MAVGQALLLEEVEAPQTVEVLGAQTPLVLPEQTAEVVAAAVAAEALLPVTAALAVRASSLSATRWRPHERPCVTEPC